MKDWGTQKSIFSPSIFMAQADFIAVAKSAYDLGLQQLFTLIDNSVNQSGSSAHTEGGVCRMILTI